MALSRWAGAVAAASVAAAWCAGACTCGGRDAAEDTAAPPGDPHRFDAVASYAGVAAFAGPAARLRHLRVVHARSDGTIDVEAEYEPTVTYDFVRPAVLTPEAAKRPVGARGKADAMESVEVTIRKPGLWSVTSGASHYQEEHLGMDRRVGTDGDTSDVVPEPSCDLRALWKAAIAAGAPADAVADISYDRSGWRLEIGDVGFDLRRYGADCSATTAPGPETGGVPAAPVPVVPPSPDVAPAVEAAPVEPAPVAAPRPR